MKHFLFKDYTDDDSQTFCIGFGCRSCKRCRRISFGRSDSKRFRHGVPAGPVNPYGKFFTGTSYLTMLNTEPVFNCPIGNVTFEPGCRTFWHKHTGGQILLVLAGEGLYQERGKPARRIKKGDVVQIAPDVEHWHGACDKHPMTHISVETNVPNNKAIWLEAVSESDYAEANKA